MKATSHLLRNKNVTILVASLLLLTSMLLGIMFINNNKTKKSSGRKTLYKSCETMDYIFKSHEIPPVEVLNILDQAAIQYPSIKCQINKLFPGLLLCHGNISLAMAYAEDSLEYSSMLLPASHANILQEKIVKSSIDNNLALSVSLSIELDQFLSSSQEKRPILEAMNLLRLVSLANALNQVEAKHYYWKKLELSDGFKNIAVALQNESMSIQEYLNVKS